MVNKHHFAVAAVLAILLATSTKAGDNKSDLSLVAGPYKPNWESLPSHPMPERLLDAKFGIYVNWGVSSQEVKNVHVNERELKYTAADIRFTTKGDTLYTP